MNKQITVNDCIDYVTKNVCSQCKFYNQNFGVCGGEVLPLERAIIRNLEGQGCCKNVKDFTNKLQSDTKNI